MESSKSTKSLAGCLLLVLIIVFGPIIYFGYTYGDLVFSSWKDRKERQERQERQYIQTNNAEQELNRVLNRIAGTYTLVENMGIGFRTVYTVVIKQNGSGYTKYADGSVEHYYNARYDSSTKRITFYSEYGGTYFKVVGDSIEDEVAWKELTEIGTHRYIMKKNR